MKRPGDAANSLARASRTLVTAQKLLDDGENEATCNRAYYAMFHAAHALLLAVGLEQASDPTKTHYGLMMKVNELVDRGDLGRKAAKWINEVQFLRQFADYSAEEIRPSDAALAIEKASAFVDAVCKSIPG